MKQYEKESLFKNFFVFFSLLEVLLILLFFELYHAAKRDYKQNLFKTMKVCSYTMQCQQFDLDFTPKDNTKLNQLHENDQGFYADFPIPKSEKYYIKISYDKKSILRDLWRIKRILWMKFVLATLLLLGIAFFFTLYSLKPIRKALRINDEFIKDILHDFNTPITAMLLNINMFKKEKGDDPFIKRVSHSIDTMLLLQNNLKSFLHHSPSQNSDVDVAALAKKRMEFIQNIYPKIKFVYSQKNDLCKWTNEELLTRILDNLLSNAAKYNKPKGTVTITILGDILEIKDTGKGIQNIDNAMKRYHKEQERGLGLGLHIVQKLLQELNIEMRIESLPNKGTTVRLDFSTLKKGIT